MCSVYAYVLTHTPSCKYFECFIAVDNYILPDARWRHGRFHDRQWHRRLWISHMTIRESRWIYDISRTMLQAHLARRHARTRWNYAVLDTLSSDNVVALHAYIHHVLIYMYLHTLLYVRVHMCAWVRVTHSSSNLSSGTVISVILSRAY